ncbi:hypothetical protein VTH06DRAFT_5835 [Thermothelomyces fergusii]
MRFANLLTTALFGAVTAASPASQQSGNSEALQLVDFYIITDTLHNASNLTTGADIQLLSFQFNSFVGSGSVPVSCAAAAAEGETSLRFNPAAYSCRSRFRHWGQYWFEVDRPNSQGVFGLTITHKDSSGVETRGRASVPTKCHAGDADSLVCSQVGDVTISLQRE